MSYTKQINEIVKYLKNNEKKVNNFKIGVEFEHFIIDKETLTTISYYKKDGVQDTLEQLISKGWEGKYEDNKLLGLSRDGTAITLEPGSQIEISIRPLKNIKDIEEEYIRFLKDIIPILEKKNQGLITTGYQPESKISNIKMIPKKRYTYMFEYFKSKGYYAHNMMKGTASVQLAVDYESEEDYIKKFKVANALSPVIYAMFDNSPFFEGQLWSKYSLRAHIWNNCDNDRCGVVNLFLDKSFGYKKYAEYILNRPPIIIDNGKEYVYTGDTTYKKLFNPDSYTIEELEHVLTMFFPDVRTKRYIEIRMVDSLPYPLNFAAVSLCKGILYNKENLDKVYRYIKDLDIKDINNAKDEIIQKGLDGKLKNKTVFEIGKCLLNISKSGLTSSEKEYLTSFEQLIQDKKTPAIKTKDKLKFGKQKALSWCMLNNKFKLD